MENDAGRWKSEAQKKEAGSRMTEVQKKRGGKSDDG